VGRKLPTANTSQQIPGRWKAKQIQNLNPKSKKSHEKVKNTRKTRFGMNTLQNTYKVHKTTKTTKNLKNTHFRVLGFEKNVKKCTFLCTIIPFRSLFLVKSVRCASKQPKK
jgi:hypothetical protein